MEKLNFQKLNLDLWGATVAFILVLLPGILVKVIGYDMTGQKAPNPLLTSTGFMNSTLVIGFILGLVALVRSKNDVTVRTVAILTMIVCVIRFVLSA